MYQPADKRSPAFVYKPTQQQYDTLAVKIGYLKIKSPQANKSSIVYILLMCCFVKAQRRSHVDYGLQLSGIPILLSNLQAITTHRELQ